MQAAHQLRKFTKENSTWENSHRKKKSLRYVDKGGSKGEIRALH